MLLMGWGIKLPDSFTWKENETRELPCLVTDADRQLIVEGYIDAYFLALDMVKRCDAHLEKLMCPARRTNRKK